MSAAICDVCDALYLTRAGDREQQRCYRCEVSLRPLTLDELWLALHWADAELERRVST
jgi:hypothetical protein